jgi:hypothetical protein
MGKGMKRKVIQLLLVGLLAAPMAAKAGFDHLVIDAEELSGTFSVVSGEPDSILTLPYLLLPQLDEVPPEVACNDLIAGRNWGGDSEHPVRDGYLFSGCIGDPANPRFFAVLAESEQPFGSVGGYYDNSGVGVSVYWRFSDLQDTGGEDGTFSGAFCFSTSRTACGISTVPEPGMFAPVGLGLAAFAASRRRKR